jgi:hypothetical protein
VSRHGTLGESLTILPQSYDPTEEQAKQLLGQMTTIVGLTEEQLGLLVQHKAHFDKLKVGGLVKRNVGKTEGASKELSEIMIGKAPASVKGEAEVLEKRRDATFAKAKSAFEGLTGGEEEADKEDDSE